MSARHMFYPEDTQFSRAEEKLFAREDLVYNVTEDILVAMEELGVSKKELARKLGKSPSFVTQTLNGSRNMTLGTLSDIAFTLGASLEARVLIKKPKPARKWENQSAPEKDNVVILRADKIKTNVASNSTWSDTDERLVSNG